MRRRFDQKYVVLDGGCWEWTGTISPEGYGRIGRGHDGAPLYAHRVSYERFVGPIPKGLHIDHLCRNRRCVNPEHLEPVTRRENILRGASTAAVHARKTHCIHGHEFTPENTLLKRRSYGVGRSCRTCNRIRQAEKLARETPDQREIRLAYHRRYMKKSAAHSASVAA